VIGICLPLRVGADHPAYAGHFPGHPVLPGVVLLDSALLVLARHLGRTEGIGQIKSAKFLSPVLPGEELDLIFEVSASGDLRFEIRAGERAVASAIFAFVDA
jgi:3-hydroxymyristoyl/3-hydroxydecanoyl-(acyl carrier protein) dehydratase